MYQRRSRKRIHIGYGIFLVDPVSVRSLTDDGHGFVTCDPIWKNTILHF